MDTALATEAPVEVEDATDPVVVIAPVAVAAAASAAAWAA